jgi:H+-translocating NAD(P) transhydrogenase subunit alpha
MIVGVPKETFPGERRVAMVPALLPMLAKASLEVVIEHGAGQAAGFPDADYVAKGGKLGTRGDVFAADAILQVRALGANPEAGQADTNLLRQGQVVIGFAEPLSAPQAAAEVAARGAMLFAMELIPRITRAQSMDALSSMASIAGYKAVLLAADALPKMFPMMMTAAGTIAPARAFVLGAGVAGLQAIATSRRLGAVVQAYDVRVAVKEQVESLGAKFLDLPLPTEEAQDKGGYAKQLSDEVYQRQREMMARAFAESDVVITTAAIPGKKAPILVTADQVRQMRPGSVIVDLASERGGNCELTRAGETITTDNGVTILGPLNLPSGVPYHASQMYAKNIATLLLHLIKDGQWNLDLSDEITRETLVTRDGQIVHARVQAAGTLA